MITNLPGGRKAGNRRFLAAIMLLCVWLPVSTVAEEPYTIDELMEMAVRHNPAIAGARAAVEEARGRQTQSALYPNPFVELMQDDVPGDSGDISDGTTRLSVGQPIIISGRRGHAVRAAEAGLDVARWNYEATRHRVFRELNEVWFEILYLSDAMQIESELITSAEEIADLAPRQSESMRAIVLAETLLARILGLSTEQAVARDRLEALLGGERVQASRLEGELESALDPSEVARLQRQSIAEHPRMQASKARLREAESRRLETASRVTPDVTVSAIGGVDGRNDEGFVGAGIMVPIPLFNRLQGERAEGRAAVKRLEAEQAESETELRAELRIMLQMLNELDTLVETYGRNIVPMAEEAFEATLQDYREGNATVTDALDALRSLGDARRSELRFRRELSDTLSRYRHFVRYGPAASIDMPESVDSTADNEVP